MKCPECERYTTLDPAFAGCMTCSADVTWRIVNTSVNGQALFLVGRPIDNEHRFTLTIPHEAEALVELLNNYDVR